MVSFVSKRYMSGVSGTESLVVCLSNYLPLCSLYILHDSSLSCFDPKGKMAKLSKCRFNFEKIRMNCSCHGRY